jgi:hypothetical protein
MADAPRLSAGPAEEVIAKRSRFVVMAGWNDVPHLTPEMIAEEKSRIPPHEFEARSLGKPSLGQGAVYPVPESEILCDPFIIPDWMPQCYALDVGWKRTAGLWGAWDRDNDVVYLYGEHYRGQAEPPIHAAAIRARGLWIPGVIDPAARGRGQKDGQALFSIYVNDLGLNLTIADNTLTGPESGIVAIWQRLTTGRLKVFRTLVNWIKEYRFYQRDEHGRIKDGQADHLMDDTRYLIMSGLSVACVRPADQWTTGKSQVAWQAEYDPLAYQTR